MGRGGAILGYFMFSDLTRALHTGIMLEVGSPLRNIHWEFRIEQSGLGSIEKENY